MKIKISEHQEQVRFIQWFELQHPTVRIFAIPNGGLRNIVTASKLKKEGARAGVPDLFIPEWLLFIEMKAASGGVLSENQKDWIQYINEKSPCTAIVAYGADDAIAKVRDIRRADGS